MIKVDNIVVQGSEANIPLRIYRPLANDKMQGVIVYYHWGGFVSGSVEESDPECILMADYCKCVVVSVGYRLAPKHRFPAAVIDSFDALKWIYNHLAELNVVEPNLAVVGTSAGGNLAAIVSILARDSKIPLKLQVLVLPVIGFDPYSSSVTMYGTSEYQLSLESIIDFTSKYLGDLGKVFHPLFTPILSDLRGLPPALIITSEKDALRDQGEAYAERLRRSGVHVIAIRLNGVGHILDEFHGKFVYKLVGMTIREAFAKTFP